MHFIPYNKYQNGIKTYLNTRQPSLMNFFPNIFPVKAAIQVRKFGSKFAGLVARHLMRREKTGDNMDQFDHSQSKLKWRF